jgi:predicted DCC family thiol-disulfide oxidoreductase YuxK
MRRRRYRRAVSVTDGPVLFVDGVCNLCAASVRFIVAHERAPTLRFASLQSPHAARALPAHGVDPQALSSLVLVVDGKAYVKSAAALRIAPLLRAPWSWAAAALVVPAVVRDVVYDAIARRRYAWFGRTDECMVPTPALRARFVDA